VPEPSAYDLILTQLARIETKLDRLPETFLRRDEYERRHEELLAVVRRQDAEWENDMRGITDRIKECEQNFVKLLWAFGGTVGVAILGFLFWFLQGHTAP